VLRFLNAGESHGRPLVVIVADVRTVIELVRNRDALVATLG